MNILALGFGNFGGPDVLMILLIVLILFGAKKLPDLARSLGQSINEFRKGREDIERELRNAAAQPAQPQPCNCRFKDNCRQRTLIFALLRIDSLKMKSLTEIDPRITRTRQMLFQALRELLAEKNFEEMTVQDIAERSTVNRGTIYVHFKDKFGLLEAMIEENLGALFKARMAGASGTCSGGVRQLILAVCDDL